MATVKHIVVTALQPRPDHNFPKCLEPNETQCLTDILGQDRLVGDPLIAARLESSRIASSPGLGRCSRADSLRFEWPMGETSLRSSVFRQGL